MTQKMYRLKKVNQENINNIKLPPLLSQFREALTDEIEVARRRSVSNAIPLTNGKKISQIANGYQYSFILDTILSIPDGAPGSLLVEGKPPIDATIISYEGLKISLSIHLDLGPFVPYAILQSDLTMLMKKLIERIEEIGNKSNPAGDRVLGLSEPRISLPENIEQNGLNEQQYKALLYGLGSEITFIWGPPGTGKTYTIGAIAKELYNKSRSLLLISHTNNAVDQALDEIATHLKNEVLDGLIIRVGVPKAFKYPKEIILKNQAELRSKKMVEKRTEYIDNKEKLVKINNDLEKKIAIIDWLKDTKSDIDLIGNNISKLIDDENNLSKYENDLLILQQDLQSLHESFLSATECIKSKQLIKTYNQQIDKLKDKIRNNKRAFSIIITKIYELNKNLNILEYITPVRYELTLLPTIQNQENYIRLLMEELVVIKKELEVKNELLGKSVKILNETTATSALMRVWKRLPKPDIQKNIVAKLKDEINCITESIYSKNNILSQEKLTLKKTLDLAQKIEPYRHLQSMALTGDELKQEKFELNRLKIDIKNAISEIKLIRGKLEGCELNVISFSEKHSTSPEEIIEQITKNVNHKKDLESKYECLKKICIVTRGDLEKDLCYKLECIKHWDLSADTISIAENMYNSIIEAYKKAMLQYKNVNINELNDNLNINKSEIIKLDTLINEINEKLKDIEKEIVSKAVIIVSTLTKTYLDDNIQSRKFDTVILDEASMAPIPALWVSANLCTKNIIIIGDFRQLPPIVLSEKEITKEWLGRDIFDKSGIKEKYETRKTPEYFITLQEQRRMPPQICRISNELFYDGNLINKTDLSDLNNINNWYNQDWEFHKNYVLLVNMSSTNAWVTSVLRGGNTSRLNFLSATISLDIAEKLLKKDRPVRNEYDPHRIFIISPYRAHSRLLKLLINEQNLSSDVTADTVHGFQGREAEIVIFDLVVDEPHFRVNLFIPENDEMLKRLFNVALTRAKNRLVIIGDFEYCEKLGKKAILGSKIIPFLIEKAKFKIVNALDIVTSGLAAKAANASMLVSGGDVEISHKSLKVTQETFYKYFYKDIISAQNRIVIFSPFITIDRVSLLDPYIKSAIENKTEIYVITKALQERGKKELQTYIKLEEHLKSIGVYLIHKLRMHEKLIFIDNGISWVGSLNPLSYSNTGEVMIREDSEKNFKEIAEIIRLDDLIGIKNTPAERCPICLDEMMAVEGADEPFYWECVKGKSCFSRSIDRPHPVDGMFICHKCSVPYKFHFTNNKPIWRCSKNNRHHMKMFASHLRLPKMLELIPKKDLKNVYKYFGIRQDKISVNQLPLG